MAGDIDGRPGGKGAIMDDLTEARNLLYLGVGREGPEDARAARELAQIHVLMDIARSLRSLEKIAATLDELTFDDYGGLVVRAVVSEP